ncbi:hypothetical protein KM043_015330 [Ampulex compressa]|nr:hypothetical protein KM043_015330 [Ampulex compressa]
MARVRSEVRRSTRPRRNLDEENSANLLMVPLAARLYRAAAWCVCDGRPPCVLHGTRLPGFPFPPRDSTARKHLGSTALRWRREGSSGRNAGSVDENSRGRFAVDTRFSLGAVARGKDLV